ncbi:MAG: DMT family transporter [Microcoleus sp. SIO2G3]|nr:DMT family transporter [Microcoleus sp. SIO2G3]
MTYGFLGVLSFSLTLPATRVAVVEFDPTFVGLGRAIVAAGLAAIALRITHQPLQTRSQWRDLAIVAFGVILGFPLLSAWAMRQLPANHGAVVIGLIPLATAIAATIRGNERPSLRFWLATAIGSATIVGFTLASGGGHFQLPDLALVGAVVAAAIGYAEGGKLARSIGGWQVICWALVLAAPVLLVPTVLAAQSGLTASPQAWLGFAYVSIVSQFLGFFAWYHGMAIAGVARVSQLQLLQPFLTIIFSALLLHEQITAPTIAAACIVIACVAIGRRSLIREKPTQI